MWELENKESWGPKNWCFWTVVLEKTLKSPLDCKEIQPIHPKGNQSWIFIGSTEAEALILWPPDGTSQLIGKDPDAGEDWRQEEKGMTEEEMVGRIQWTWVWASSGRWWRTGKLGVLQSMGLQRVGHDWKTKQQQNSNRIPDFTCWLDLALVWQHGILSKLFGMYITFHIYQFFCYHSIVWRKNGYFDIPWYMELC